MRQGATKSGFLWLFAKDFRPDNSYDTGMALQLIFDIKEKTGMSSNEAANKVIDDIRRRGIVVHDCETERVLDFERHCLEVLEERGKSDAARVTYHVLYSVSYHVKYDFIALTVFGAPASAWDDVVPVTRVMSDIRLFGPEFARKVLNK